MASTIRIKRSTGTSAPGSLKTGELAYSYGSGTEGNGGDRLYFGKGDDGSGNATSIVTIGGEFYKGLVDHAAGTLTASSAIIVDASSKIDVLNVDNITINGNTISSTDTNGNIVLDPNGSGVVDVNTSRITNVTDPTDAQDAATKAYVDTQVGGGVLSIIGDGAQTDNITLADSTLSFAGGTGLTSAVSDNTVTFNLDNTGVTAQSYGSSTAVPVITVNAQGQITAATTATVSSTLNLAAEGPTTGDISLVDSSLSIVGGTGIATSVSANEFTITTVDTEIVHDNLSGFVADEHIDHSTVTLTAGAGLTGGGTIAASRSFAVGAGSGIAVNADDVAIDSAGLYANYSLSGFNDYVANENVDHSGVSIIAGTGLTGGGDITASRTLNVIGGDGITANADEIEVTVDNTTIELSASDGSGAIRVKDGGISNAKLANSSFTLGSDAVSLGDTITDVNGLTQLDVDNIRIDGNTISSTDVSNTLYIDPAPVDSNGGELVIRGNLTVQGTTTTINSTELSVNDLNIILADSAANAAAADGAGITVGGAGYSGTKATITYDGSNDTWDFNKTLDITDGTNDLTSININGVTLRELIEDHLSSQFTQGIGIDITYTDNGDAAGTFTFAGELATSTNAGIAAFDSVNFALAGAENIVTIATVDGGIY